MPLEEEVHLLSRVGILEPLSDEDLRGLLRRSLDTHLQAGETFFTPEDTSERLFILKIMADISCALSNCAERM